MIVSDVETLGPHVPMGPEKKMGIRGEPPQFLMKPKGGIFGLDQALPLARALPAASIPNGRVQAPQEKLSAGDIGGILLLLGLGLGIGFLGGIVSGWTFGIGTGISPIKVKRIN